MIRKWYLKWMTINNQMTKETIMTFHLFPPLLPLLVYNNKNLKNQNSKNNNKNNKQNKFPLAKPFLLNKLKIHQF